MHRCARGVHELQQHSSNCNGPSTLNVVEQLNQATSHQHHHNYGHKHNHYHSHSHNHHHHHHQHQHQHQHYQHQHHNGNGSSNNNHHHHNSNASQSSAQLKRKEKARIAATARRSQEASIISEMASELRITQEKTRKIDKATIVKLAIDYIRAFEFLCRCRSPQSLGAITNFCQHQQKENNDDNGNSNNSNQRQRTEVDETKSQLQPLQQIRPPDNANLLLLNETTQTSHQDYARHYEQTKDMNTHFLVVDECDGKAALRLKPDTELLDEDDLTHLAPQAGDVSIPLEVEPLDEIVLDKLL